MLVLDAECPRQAAHSFVFIIISPPLGSRKHKPRAGARTSQLEPAARAARRCRPRKYALRVPGRESGGAKVVAYAGPRTGLLQFEPSLGLDHCRSLPPGPHARTHVQLRTRPRPRSSSHVRLDQRLWIPFLSSLPAETALVKGRVKTYILKKKLRGGM